ncbi:sulfatase [candidate division KSB1 bacterium]|nr:sulfatase [candidate division KSB1 bacterium]
MQLQRRRFLKTAGLATLGLAALNCSTKSRQPNIVFIMSDDHTRQAMSCYGSRINKTPNLDRIAAGGMRFDNCFVTNSICAPSRAVILTGKFSHINGVTDNNRHFDGSQQTFPKLLQQAGYQTAMVGKWHLKTDPTGFDFWKVLPGQGNYYNPDFKTPEGQEQIEGYVTDIITDVALEWLKQRRDPQKPFLLMYHHKAPHRAWWPGPDHLKTYAGETIAEPDNLFDDYADRGRAAKEQEQSVAHDLRPSGDLKLKPEQAEVFPDTSPAGIESYNANIRRMTESQRQAWDDAFDPRNEAAVEQSPEGKDLVRWKYQRYIKDYLRCVASVDDNVGRLLDYLEKAGLTENTIVVYTSDQGFYLGEHGWFDKRFMYEESFSTPLLVRWPRRIKAGSVNKVLVQNLDFAETFLEAAGAEIPADMQGRSLLPLLHGKTPADWRDAVYYHYFEYPGAHMVKRHYGIRTKRYKLLHFYYDIDEWELYDMEKDPHEMKNVYGDPEYQEIVNNLLVRLEELRRQYGDIDDVAKRVLEEDLAHGGK